MVRYLMLSVFLVASAAAQTSGQTAAGNDYLARLLHQGEISWGMMLAGLAVAFALGAVHAMSPGHGKTIVAAYLVGSRGTASHAIFLGGMVTFTHTITVFLLGLGTLFLSRYILPEKIVPVLGVISGVSIVWIGAILLYKRIRAARHMAHHHHHHEHDHGHAHDHGHHDHEHAHDHEHPHDHGHEHHDHGTLLHDHGDGHVHSHVPEGEISMGSLMALGASGGLVPCPSALVLLLSAIALGRTGLGLGLLVAFSLGLAGVLMAIGLIVLYAKHLLPDSEKASRHAAFRLIPVASAAVIVCVGLIMTGVSLGVIRPDQFLAGV
jgi:nickel/cobalt exporter